MAHLICVIQRHLFNKIGLPQVLRAFQNDGITAQAG